MNLNQFVMEDEYVKVIDPITKEVIGVFNGYSDAGKKLYMSPKVIRSAACTKTRRFCERLNKEIVVRVVSKTKSGAV